VTKEQVMSLFREAYFENPKRFNVKVHAKKHYDDTETRKVSLDLNEAHYGENRPTGGALTVDNI
jgi:hypothetical protein